MIAVLKGCRTEHAKQIRRQYGDYSGMCMFQDKYYTPRNDGISNTITTVLKDNYLYMNASKEAIINEINNLQPDEYVRIRKFTPRECLRLMGVRDDKIDLMMNSGVSNSQLYKQAGNSIVVDCMVAMFDNLFFPPQGEEEAGTQLSLW